MYKGNCSVDLETERLGGEVGRGTGDRKMRTLRVLEVGYRS